MNIKSFRIILACLLISLFSCQDKVNTEGTEVDIIPAEEKKDELRDGDRPMPNSYLLAKMRENNELSSFLEEFQKSGLEEEFEGEEGLYTIFAPSNAAYDRIPAKEMNTDTTAEAATRKDLMQYYIVEGEMTVSHLLEKIRASENGRYEFETALGEKLWATEEGGDIVLIDVLGNKAKILTSEMEEYYGAIHMLDNVLQPGERPNEVENDI